jgi:endo-1,4-beta-xylanase
MIRESAKESEFQGFGMSDRLTWLSGQAPRKDGLPVRVLPLDDQLQRKPAWTAVVNALSGR